MDRAQQQEWTARHPNHPFRIAAGSLLALGALSAAPAQTVGTPQQSEPIDETLKETMQGHGSVAIGYQTFLANGFLDYQGSNNHVGATRSRRIDLDIAYDVADRWSVNVGLPYISNSFVGRVNHCPTTAPPQCQDPTKTPALIPQHPESQFLDDGDYHGTWQDWTLGATYHTNIGTYYLNPSITVYIPSHDYTFFGQAAVGQDLWQLELAVTLAHQFDFSSLYYRVGYGYVLTEKTLGVNENNSRYDLELGYFVNPELTVRISSLGRFGGGLQSNVLTPLTNKNTNDYWYYHDKITAHEYASAGVGLDYQFDKKYTFSASAQKLIWGRSVFNFVYLCGVQMTRSF